MYITSGVDTVVLHMPKCGGSSVRWAINKKYPDYRWSCEHVDIKALPERFKDFRRIGFCRNPITWYKSKYYHAYNRFQHGKSNSLIFSNILSNGFKLSFERTLPRYLDVRNFFDMHPEHLAKFKKRVKMLSMNEYLCRAILTYPDASEITAADFGDTLYDHWYNAVGLDTAVVYKMDDGSFASTVAEEFPGVVLEHRNKGNCKYASALYTSDMKRAIYQADRQYFDLHGYPSGLSP